jgi:hypothetical protein
LSIVVLVATVRKTYTFDAKMRLAHIARKAIEVPLHLAISGSRRNPILAQALAFYFPAR